MDLGGQFPGRCQHQGAWPARAAHGLGGGTQVLQQRQAEGGGLAGAGLGAGQQIVAGQHQRDGLLLDRGGGFVALLGQGTQQEGRKAQGFERHRESSMQ